MGGRPLTALNVLGIPEDKVPPEVIAQILRGGAHAAKKAHCVILGGHTIRNPEPIYGMAVTGIVHPKRMLTNAAARPGDLLVLTKPLGTGIAATAIKRGLASPHLTRRAITIMRQLNTAGAELAEKSLVRGATDVTGFGLLGHLASMCGASGVGAQLVASEVPALSPEVHDLIANSCIPGGTRTNLQAAREIATWNATLDAAVFLLADAQTSGGLLLCVRPKHLDAVRTVLKKHRTPARAVIGHITKSRRPLMVVA
jgi:selenide,water dikinase